MDAVIFEVQPHPTHYDAYLNMAAELWPEFEKIDGVISIERFASLSDEGKIFSLSFFRDETAIKAWREQLDHRRAHSLDASAYLKTIGYGLQPLSVTMASPSVMRRHSIYQKSKSAQPRLNVATHVE